MCTSKAQKGGGNGAGVVITEDESSSLVGSATAAPAARSAGALLSDMPGGMAEKLNQLDAARQILHTCGQNL